MWVTMELDFILLKKIFFLKVAHCCVAHNSIQFYQEVDMVSVLNRLTNGDLNARMFVVI